MTMISVMQTNADYPQFQYTDPIENKIHSHTKISKFSWLVQLTLSSLPQSIIISNKAFF